MNEGDTLNDGNFTISEKKEAFTVITIITDVIDRIILASETITTPAGIFRCNKVSFN